MVRVRYLIAFPISDLHRKAPDDDGGSPIKHYVTEILNFTTNNIWTSVAMSDTGDCTEQEIEHLIEGHRYCFRVAAVNRLGQSDPQEIRGEIVTKDPWGKILVLEAHFYCFFLRCSICMW